MLEKAHGSARLPAQFKIIEVAAFSPRHRHRHSLSPIHAQKLSCEVHLLHLHLYLLSHQSSTSFSFTLPSTVSPSLSLSLSSFLFFPLLRLVSCLLALELYALVESVLFPYYSATLRTTLEISAALSTLLTLG